MLKDRIISSLVGVPIIVACLFLGQYVFGILVAAIVAISVDEFYSMLVMRDYKPNIIIGMLGSLLVAASAVVFGAEGVVFGTAVTALAALIWRVFHEERITDTALTVIGLIYIAVPLSLLTLLYRLDNGLAAVLCVFIGTWISDIAAYTIGKSVGKRKLAPTISENKTIEGTFAGAIAPAAILAIVFALPWLPFAASQGILLAMAKGAILGLLIGLAAPMGDLIESSIKREMRIKDSGVIIPGHGGFLDRFDSMILTAVVGYYFWLIVM